MAGVVAFYADLKIMLPLMVAVGALLLAAATIGARWRNSECFPFPYILTRLGRASKLTRAHCRLALLLLLQDTRRTGSSGR